MTSVYVPTAPVVYAKNLGGIDHTGATDSTVALATALDALSPGQTLDTSDASILFSSISNATDRITLAGNGTLTSSMTNDGVTNAMWLKGDNVVVDGPNFAVQNPLLPFNHSNLNNGFLLMLGSVALPAAEKATVRNCSFSGAFTSNCEIRNARNAIVTGNRSENPAGNGISLTNVTDTAIVTANEVYNCGDDMIVSVTDATVPTGAQRLVITDNICDTGDAKGIAVVGGDKVVVANNHVKNTWTFGLSAFSDSAFNLGPSHRVIIANNTLDRIGYKYGSTPANLHSSASVVPNGVYIGSGVHGARVTGNVAYDTLGIGIQADYQTVSTTSSGSHTLPVGTVTVASTANFPSAGTVTIIATNGTATSFTFTGKTGTTFTGCSGGRGTFASGSTVLPATVGLSVDNNEVVGAGGAGILVGNPDGSDWIRLLDVSTCGNRVRNTHGGIVGGSITGWSVLGNHVRSYKQGDAGTKRGIQIGSVRNTIYDHNIVFNDDGGDEAIVVYGSNKHVLDGGNNIALAPADA